VTRKPADFERLGDLLKDVRGPLAGGAGTRDSEAQEGGGDKSRSAARLLALVWPEVVGEEVAANARPVQLRQGRLVVSASSASWAQTLQLMGDAIIDRLNERLGGGAVDRVVFRHAGWEESGGRALAGPGKGAPETDTGGSPVGPQGRPATRPTVEEEAAVAGVRKLGLGPELEESILRAVRASFRRS